MSYKQIKESLDHHFGGHNCSDAQGDVSAILYAVNQILERLIDKEKCETDDFYIN